MSNPKITGLGGVFFKAQAPEKLKEWYARNLGLILMGQLSKCVTHKIRQK
jgi:hypothetical protein